MPLPTPGAGAGERPGVLQKQGFPGARGRKLVRVRTMDVAVAVRLGVIKLSGMRWRATTLMPLDPHDHGSPSGLRVCFAAPGPAIERLLRVEMPSAVHPQCEAVLECG